MINDIINYINKLIYPNITEEFYFLNKQTNNSNNNEEENENKYLIGSMICICCCCFCIIAIVIIAFVFHQNYMGKSTNNMEFEGISTEYDYTNIPPQQLIYTHPVTPSQQYGSLSLIPPKNCMDIRKKNDCYEDPYCYWTGNSCLNKHGMY